MINNGIKYSHGLQARGNRGAFLCGLKTKKSLTAGPISLSQGFTLFGITSCLLHEYAFCPYQVETKRQYRGVAVVWYFSPQWLWNFEFLICDISWSAFVAEASVLTSSWPQAAWLWCQMSVCKTLNASVDNCGMMFSVFQMGLSGWRHIKNKHQK